MHLSDFADLAPEGGDFSGMASCTERCLRFFFMFFEDVYYVLRLHNHIIFSAPEGVTYNRATGKYNFFIPLSDDLGDYILASGFIVPVGQAYIYDWLYIYNSDSVIVDSVYCIVDSIPPTYIEDGFQGGETALFPWTARRDFPFFYDVGVGRFTLHMYEQTYGSYQMVPSDRVVLSPNDGCLFELTSLMLGWDILTEFTDAARYTYTYERKYYRCLQWDTEPNPDTCLEWTEVTSWPYDSSEVTDNIIDSAYIFPFGSMEFVVRSRWGSDSLYALIVYPGEGGSATTQITGQFAGQTRNMTIDLKTYEITY